MEQEEWKHHERMLKFRALAGNFTAGSATAPEMPHDFLNSSSKFVDKRIATLNAKQLMEKDKSKFTGQELMGKTLAVCGLGNIGCLVAEAGIDLLVELLRNGGHSP